MTQNKLRQIRELVLVGTRDRAHDFTHLERVRKTALQLAEMLGVVGKLDLNLLQAICYLHDTTYMRRKSGLYTYVFEGRLVRQELKSILPKLRIGGAEAKIILRACVRHPHSLPFGRLNRGEDLYTRILQDSDTIDYFNKQRVLAMKQQMTKVPLLGRFLVDLVDNLIVSCLNNLGSYLNFPEFGEKIQKFSYLEFGGKDKKPILCLHGYADTAEMYRQFGRRLSDTHRIIALDFPMSGGNDRAYSPEALTEYVLEFVKQINLKHFDLFGFSLGGLVAIMVAHKSKRVGKLYVANVTPAILNNRLEKAVYGIIYPVLRTRLFCSLFARRNNYSVYATMFGFVGVDLTNIFNKLPNEKHPFCFKDDEVIRFGWYRKQVEKLRCRKHFFENGGARVKSGLLGECRSHYKKVLVATL